MTATTLTSTQLNKTGVAAPAATTWKIDASHSHVEFAVKHLMISTVKGRFTEVEGDIVIDEANPASSRVEVKIPAASIDTRESTRDAHLRSADFFDAENHPYLTFTSTGVELDGSDLTVRGDLTIRGTTLPVTLEGEYLGSTPTPFGTTVAAFSAKTKVNRKDYGLHYNAALETGGVLVGDEIKISLEVEAVKQA